jgi:hypothetical protein
MNNMRLLLLVCLALVPTAASAAAPQHAIDPRTVQRWGPGYRYAQAGWIVVHVEGEPYARGVQHGRLLAPEIAAHLRCSACTLSPKAPLEAWKLTRNLASALFLRGYDREYLEEMKGIADGASAAGARFDGRHIDLVDIVALNGWPEIETLEHGLKAEPTGLEGLRFPGQPRPKAPAKPMHCSAFAATGPATKDGKIVFGHITMFSLYPSNFYNVWLDIKPARGHRVVMQSFPGGIHSGMDYYINDAGLLISETTIAQTRFDVKGAPLASRIRQAIQYADSIDRAVAILQKNNNGLYTNEWLLGDIKTDEIAMFELGTRKTRLWRSSKDEWFGGARGFYWGCNNTKDLEVRLETVPGTKGRPADLVFSPSNRDQKWLKLFDTHKGRMDEAFGKLAFTTPPLAAFSSIDAKFTTSAMAKRLESWALFGPPLGKTWHPTFDQRSKYREVRPLVSNPWTILHAQPPSTTDQAVAVDLHDLKGAQTFDGPPHEDEPALHRATAWRGSLLPKSDGDVWLATSFPAYERYVALERALKKQHQGKDFPPAAQDRLDVELLKYRAMEAQAALAWRDVPLVKVQRHLRHNHWQRLALGKGTLLLHALRQKLGDKTFVAIMDDFGTANAGKEVTTADFRAHVETASGKKLGDLFDTWLEKPGLPGQAGAGAPYTVRSFYPEVEETLIVYGTADDEAGNREAAVALEAALRRQGANVEVPIKRDRDVGDDELKGRHLLLVGRPSTNTVARRFQDRLPATFGPRSVKVRDDLYAHPDTAVLVASANPLNKRYSLVVIAGLEAASTGRAVASWDKIPAAEVVILRPGLQPRGRVVPPVAKEKTARK